MITQNPWHSQPAGPTCGMAQAKTAGELWLDNLYCDSADANPPLGEGNDETLDAFTRGLELSQRPRVQPDTVTVRLD